MELDTQDLELDLPNFPVPDQPEPSSEGTRTEERAQASQPQAVVSPVEENQPRQEEGEAQRKFEENLRHCDAQLQRQNRQQLRLFKVPNEGTSDTCSPSSEGEDLNRAIKRCRPPTNDLLVPTHPLVRTTYCSREAQLSSTTGTESEPEQVASGMYMRQRKLQVVPNVPCEKNKQRRFVTWSVRLMGWKA